MRIFPRFQKRASAVSCGAAVRRAAESAIREAKRPVRLSIAEPLETRRLLILPGHFPFLSPGHFPFPVIFAPTYVVTSTVENTPIRSFGGPLGLTLPQAILAADAFSPNAYAGDNSVVIGTPTIDFRIPQTDPGYANGVYTIKTTGLPPITQALTIDGTSQPGFNIHSDKPVIVIEGINIGSNQNGLDVEASNCTIEGLDIVNFGGFGINISAPNAPTMSNLIEGNYIGIDPTGTTAEGNGVGGIRVYNSNSNTIGGTTFAERNVISGNTSIILVPGHGVGIDLEAGLNNVIEGNFIGTNWTGTKAVGNTTGIFEPIGGAAYYTIIGGTAAGAGNVISGNTLGIEDYGTETIEGNFIGTNASGAKIPNIGGGIVVGGPTEIIGAVGAPNLIEYNGNFGISLGVAPNSQIIGNTISWNQGPGIEGGGSDQIGGTAPGTGNTFTNNAWGIANDDDGENLILGNTFADNAELGIDFGNTGITALNTTNGSVNFPVLTSATVASGTLTITGTLNSTPSSTFRVELFSNPTGSASTYGQGETYLGYVNVNTDVNGNSGSFTFTTSAPTGITGSWISATASSVHSLGPLLGGTTSEFSQDIPVVPAVSTGSLAGSQTVAVSSYDLTTLGTTDWAHWGRGGVYGNFDDKATGGSQISNVTQINPGGADFGGYTVSSRSVNWTGGTPTVTDNGDDGYIWANNAVGAGFSFTVPAGTTAQTLYIYAGGYNSDATLTATLSDGSAMPVTLTASGTAAYTDFYTINFQAASAGQTLTISYTKAPGGAINGSVDLIAAALA